MSADDAREANEANEARETGWYRNYFGPEYLQIYRFADTNEQRAFLTRALAEYLAGARVLDLPCGHGRHAVHLAQAGAAMHGLDLNRLFLGLARQAAREAEVPLRLARGDMRRTPWADAAFDAAICMFTSLGYFDDPADNQQVLDEFARVVRPGGRFILDLANIDAVRRQKPSASWEKDGVRVDSRYLWDEATKRAGTERRATFADGRTTELSSSVRLYEETEILAMLDRAGWRVEEQRGSYGGGPVDDDSPRRILLCRR